MKSKQILHHDTKSRKLRNSKISISESFVSFVRFVVKIISHYALPSPLASRLTDPLS